MRLAITSLRTGAVELPLTEQRDRRTVQAQASQHRALFDLFYGAGAGVAHLFLVTEFVSNGDLVAAAICKHQIPKDPTHRELYARRTVGAICRALAYAHNNGVTHRDVKLWSARPSNCATLAYPGWRRNALEARHGRVHGARVGAR